MTGTGSASNAFQKSLARRRAARRRSTGCHGVQAASRSAAASTLPDGLSMTQALASDETDAGSSACCGTKMAIEAPSGCVRSAVSVFSSASGPMAKSNSRTSCWRAASPMASALEWTSVVRAMSRRWSARMP